MSHIKLMISVLFLFFSTKGYASCTLLEKNVDLRKYSFKCNNEIINIQCKFKGKEFCAIDIKNNLQSKHITISDDQLNALNLFSTSDLSKVTCDKAKMVCDIESNVCKKYDKYFKSNKEKEIKDNRSDSRCSGVRLGSSVRSVEDFSENLVSDIEFEKSSCISNSNIPINSLKNRIAVFRKIINLSTMDRESLLYNCVGLTKDTSASSRDKAVENKQAQLLDLRTSILNRMTSPQKLKEMVCRPNNEIFFKNDKLNVETVMCVIVEESSMALSDSGINCGVERISDFEDKFSSTSVADLAAASYAKSDTTPLEQKPLPEAMASEVGKPIGLAPALANVDKIAPGSGVTQGVTPSETAIAAGGVINTIPIKAALDAGNAFEPIYKKFSNIAASVPTSSRTGTIGRSSPKSITGASGLVTVSQKKSSASSSDSPLDSSAVVAKTAVSATAAGKGSNLNQNSDTDLTVNTASRGKGTTNEVGPKLGGARRNNLGTSRLPSSGGGAVSVGSNTNAETVSPAEIAIVQRKISQLDSPDKINSFFKQEVVNIPDLRAILYSDKSINKSLASKGIRVSNQNGDAVGDQTSNAKYIYSDTGSNFVRLNVSRRN